MSEEAAAEAKEKRSTQTYTFSSGQTVNAEQNSQSVADKRARDFDAYMEMTGEAMPTQSDMEEWLQGHKSAYKTEMGLASLASAKPTTDVVMEWLRAERMAEGTV